jgi:hypothetical protein
LLLAVYGVKYGNSDNSVESAKEPTLF